MQPDITVRDLSIEYSSGGYAVRPIDKLDLDLRSSDLVLLLGASGSGKTTLLSAFASLLTPASGTIRVGDINVTSLHGKERVGYRRDAVGIVFQAFNLVPSLSARENVMVPLRGAGRSRSAARRRADELLAMVNLSERARHRPGDLSGGEQQRVAIARALALDPPLVLADEPTAHLDYVQVDSVLHILRELAVPGRAVIVATHDERLLPLADRVVELTPRAAPTARPPERVSLEPGRVLFRQGEPGDLVYVVESGTIEIVRERADGTEELLDVVKPPGYFGELAPMFGLRRSATARTGREPTVVTGMTVRDFRAQRAKAAPTP
jgi:putative ABC transport system ATP-binding protein